MSRGMPRVTTFEAHKYLPLFSYVEALEVKVKKYEGLIKRVTPPFICGLFYLVTHVDPAIPESGFHPGGWI